MRYNKLYRAILDSGSIITVHAPTLEAAKRKVERLTREDWRLIARVRPGHEECDHHV